MAVFELDAADPDPQHFDAAVQVVPWATVEVPATAYIEYRDYKPIGQLWPRGGLPEGTEVGPQST